MTLEAAPSKYPDLAGCRVLVCAEWPEDVLSPAPLLESLGYTRVIAVDQAQRVLPLAQAGGFDLVVLDLQGPDAEGLALIESLRQRAPAFDFPILVLGGADAGPGTTASLQAGANDYLHKPVDPAEFALRVHKLLSLRAAFAQAQSSNDRLQAEVRRSTSKLDTLIENGLLMSATRDVDKLFHHALFEGQRLLHCHAATLYLVTPQKTLQFAMRTLDDPLPAAEIPLMDPHTGQPNDRFVSVYVALHGKSVLIDNVYQETHFDVSGTREFDRETHYRTVSMLVVPMASRGGAVLGVLQFINKLDPVTGDVVPFPADWIGLVEALAAHAAVTYENLQLVNERKAFMESLIHTIATAIDAKSPYTGRHSERVPELALMLAQAANDADVGPLADFRFQSEDEWHEFRVGAWLHDCGKITTPEHVIDKATKLETLYNRIHEIRMRFEVLLRDADIERLRGLVGASQAEADACEVRFAQRREQLRADFAFIAQCNRGAESMDDADVARIRQIAQNRWLRHFDDQLGISIDELQRYPHRAPQDLPVAEALLQDADHHIIARGGMDIPDPKFGFKVDVPEYLYNLGEIYNLSVRRGTLTREDRYKINEHMMHGIMMLERMPFPESLKRVPEYAGTHHETLLGTGYPRRLSASDLSVPARIMVIADIFEALTAADRPYKTPKMFSEAIQILHGLTVRGNIDADIFRLFLTSGVHLQYARKYLQPGQLDAVQIDDYL